MYVQGGSLFQHWLAILAVESLSRIHRSKLRQLGVWATTKAALLPMRTKPEQSPDTKFKYVEA